MTTAPQAIADNCGQITQLAPRLRPALRRDNTAGGRYGRLESGLAPVNTDVLAVMISLRYEIPAATIRACYLVGEPLQQRTLNVCLIALPRLAYRMQVLSLITELRQLEHLTRGWVRQAKRALGLRRPDISLGTPCPACDEGSLQVAGAEGFLRRHAGGAVTVEWVHDPRVYCPHCGASWPQAEWEHLILVIQQHAQRQQEMALVDST